MDLKDLDLNLLLIFDTLVRERRVSATAHRLGMTQPAVSNALKRLRGQLGDPLFVPTARGMEPTAFAMELADPIARALGTIHDTLSQHTRFEPEGSQRRFVVAMSDIGEIYFLPRLMERLAAEAPGVTLATVRTTGAGLAEDLASGAVDLAVGWLPQLDEGFQQRRLFNHHYVCMFRAAHPLARKRTVTLQDFEAAEHVVVSATGTGHALMDQSIDRLGVRRRVVLTVPHFVAVGHILAATDLVATVPERFARHCVEPFRLRLAAHPVKLPEIAIRMFWHPRFRREPGSQWLRGMFHELFAD